MRIKYTHKDGKIVGITMFDKRESSHHPTGYCACIEITEIGGKLMVWTDGKYRYFPKSVIKAIREMWS